MGSTSVEAEDAKSNNAESNNNGSPTPSREGDTRNSVEEAATASDSCSGRTVVSRNSIVEIPNAIHSWSGQMAIAHNPSVHRPSRAYMWAGDRSRRSALLPPSSDSSSRRSWRLSFSVSKRRQDGMLPVTGSNAGWRSQFLFLNSRKDVQDQGNGSHKTNIQLPKCFMHNWFSKKNRGSTGPVVPLDSREHLFSFRKPSYLRKTGNKDQYLPVDLNPTLDFWIKNEDKTPNRKVRICYIWLTSQYNFKIWQQIFNLRKILLHRIIGISILKTYIKRPINSTPHHFWDKVGAVQSILGCWRLAT